MTKTFENRLRLELVDLVVELDGEEQDLPPGGIPDATIVDEEELVFVDEYVEVEGGRATVLVRTFETLEDSSETRITLPDGTENERDSSGESELEGVAVRFEWEDGEYTVAFAEGEDGDEDLLDGLSGDADFLFMVPDEDVEVGDTWTLDASSFQSLTSPGGDVAIMGDDQDADEAAVFFEEFRDNLYGELEATLASVEDGVALIEFEGDVETEVESEVELPPGAPAELEITQTILFEFEVEGRLRWDVERGIALSYEMSCDVEMRQSTARARDGREMVETQVFEGTFEGRGTFE